MGRNKHYSDECSHWHEYFVTSQSWVTVSILSALSRTSCEWLYVSWVRYVRSHFLLNGDPIKDWTFRSWTRFYLVLGERRVIDPNAGCSVYRTAWAYKTVRTGGNVVFDGCVRSRQRQDAEVWIAVCGWIWRYGVAVSYRCEEEWMRRWFGDDVGNRS